MRLLLLLILSLPMLNAAEGLWMEDFEAAKAKAKAEGKDLLIDFTGSDWCNYCIMLKEEVFVHKEFYEAAQKRFILVEIDFPNNKEQSEELKEQNAALAQKYQIQVYPTILLTDHDGATYAKTGYEPGGPEAYLKHIDSLRAGKLKRETALAQAKSLKGMERVDKLGEVLISLIENRIEKGQDEIVNEIRSLDANDSRGFIAAYEFDAKLDSFESILEESKDYDKVLKEVLAMQPKIKIPQQMQILYFYTGSLYMDGKKDKAKALEYFKKSADVHPDSLLAQRIYMALEREAAQSEQSEQSEPQDDE